MTGHKASVFLRSIPLAAGLVLIAATIAQAADSLSPAPEGEFTSPLDGPTSANDWKLSAGIATLYMPAFAGSKDYQAMVLPDIKLEYRDEFFASLFDGVGYNLINNDGWRAGPIMKYDFGRTEDDDNPFRIAGKKTKALRGLGDVDGTVELGGFVEYNFDPVSYTAELRQGVGGHKGLTGEVAISYMGMLDGFGPPVIYAIGPRATFANAKYNNAYFGISRTQSANSGLDRYTADAGLVSYGLGAFAMMPVTDSLSLGLMARYDRLGSEAADSPLVRERGRKNQMMGGLRLTYEFGF
ncbi:MipA/OmpV family protein [Niveispirillum sp. KHB5.9]|uniref:MipA/OmpV family protein n=1 Tax=Niveispirillum sp. KHB5.9 TaxID=3400269 RepID=UPI003A846F9A